MCKSTGAHTAYMNTTAHREVLSLNMQWDSNRGGVGGRGGGEGGVKSSVSGVVFSLLFNGLQLTLQVIRPTPWLNLCTHAN